MNIALAQFITGLVIFAGFPTITALIGIRISNSHFNDLNSIISELQASMLQHRNQIRSDIQMLKS
jgi:hypothetical protein